MRTPRVERDSIASTMGRECAVQQRAEREEAMVSVWAEGRAARGPRAKRPTLIFADQDGSGLCDARSGLAQARCVWSVQLNKPCASNIARDLKRFLGGVVCNTDPVTIRISLTASETGFTARTTWRLSSCLHREGSRPVAGSAAKCSGEVEAEQPMDFVCQY